MRGFTLLELITIMALMGVLLAVTVPSFLGYRDSQTFQSAVNNFVNEVNLARIYATSNVNLCVPSSSTHAITYNVNIPSGSPWTYQIQASCSDSTSQTVNGTSHSLPANISFGGISTIPDDVFKFHVLTGTLPADNSVQITNTIQTKQVVVTQNGVISVH